MSRKIDNPAAPQWQADAFKNVEGRITADDGVIDLKLIDASGNGTPVSMKPSDATGVIGYILALAQQLAGRTAVPGKPASSVAGLQPIFFGYGRGASASETRLRFQIGHLGLVMSIPTADLIAMSKSVLERQSRGDLGEWKSH